MNKKWQLYLVREELLYQKLSKSKSKQFDDKSTKIRHTQFFFTTKVSEQPNLEVNDYFLSTNCGQVIYFGGKGSFLGDK